MDVNGGKINFLGERGAENYSIEPWSIEVSIGVWKARWCQSSKGRVDPHGKQNQTSKYDSSYEQSRNLYLVLYDISRKEILHIKDTAPVLLLILDWNLFVLGLDICFVSQNVCTTLSIVVGV